MGGFVDGLLFACFGRCCGASLSMAALAAGGTLLVAAAQFFLLAKRKRAAWLPVPCAAAALCSSFLYYLAVSREVYLPFFRGWMGDLVIYASVAAVYLLPGLLAGWLAYLVWSGLRLVRGTGT